MRRASLALPRPVAVDVERFAPASGQARALSALSFAVARPAIHLALRAAGPRLVGLASQVDQLGVLLPRPRGVAVQPFRIGPLAAEWVRAQEASEANPAAGVVLYFHGGAFITCGLKTHRPLMSRISAASGVPVLNVAYRQLPEAGISTSTADGLAAYRYLLDSGVPAGRIVIAGDSAGGYVAFSALAAAQSMGLPMPAGIVGLSPLADLDIAVKADSPTAHTDPVFTLDAMRRIIALVTDLGGAPDRWHSPLVADLTGFAPTLLQIGSTEILRTGAETLADRLAYAGVPCRLEIWDQQVHVFQGVGGNVVPEARTAIANIGKFVRQSLTLETTTEKS